MARTDVYLNINATTPAAAVVVSKTDSTETDFPELVLGDAPEFNFYFTDGTDFASWAGSGSYSVEWSLSDAQATNATPWAYTAVATAITGGWSVQLPLSASRLINELNARNYSQEYPVERLWQQIRVLDSDGVPVTYAFIRTRVRLRTVSNAGEQSNTPTPSSALTQAQLATFNASSNASGTTTAGPGQYSIMHFEEVTISGAGSTTRVLVLPTTARTAGQRLAVRFLCPATAGITLEVRNATSGGTLLLSAQTDGSGDDVAAEFYFNGTDWKSFEAQFAS